MEIFSESLENLSPKVSFGGSFSLQEHQSILVTVWWCRLPLAHKESHGDALLKNSVEISPT